MHPAQAKKFYSVKEAAKLLGVSTNTIYTYLKEGKLVARRYGKGRFKIPYSQIEPYADSTSETLSETVNETSKTGTVVSTGLPGTIVSEQVILQQPDPIVQENLSVTPKLVVPPISDNQVSAQTNPDVPAPAVSEEPVPGLITPANNDKIFWRLFKGLSFLGFGLIYAYTSKSVFNFSGSFFEERAQVFNLLMPAGLILSGILTLLDVFFEEKVRPFDPLIHIVSTLVLSYFAFVSAVTGEYGRFAIAGSFAILTALHLVQGVSHRGTFYESMTKFRALLSLLVGIVLILFPSLFPIAYLREIIILHRGIAGIVWFGLSTVPLLYLLSDAGKKSKTFASIFYLLTGIVSLILATELAVQEKWDTAYIAYLIGIFGMFLAWWNTSSILIHKGKFHQISASFIWVSVAILVGLFVVKDTSIELKKQREIMVLSSLDQSAQKMKNKLDESSALLTGYAGKPETVSLIESRDEEALIARAKDIYDRSDLARRVLIYDSEGKAIGVYPRESLAQGTDFSGRDYYQKTRSDLKGVVSNVFVAVNSEKTVIVTQPIFKDNSFYGMIGMGIDLEKLSVNVRNEFGGGNLLHVFDESGVYAFGSNPGDIGKKRNETEYLPAVISNQNLENGYLHYEDSLTNPSWKFYLQVPDYSLSSRSSYINIFLTLFVVINSIFSVFAGLAISTRKEVSIDPKSNLKSIARPELNLGVT